MRVSPIGWAFQTPQQVMMEAQQTASITHCHSGGIAGAQATALAVFMARAGASKDDIAAVMVEWFEYDVNLDLEEYHREYTFDVSCMGTVPPAIACVLQANSFEEVCQLGLYIGGDTDTLLSVACAIAEPLYGIPTNIREQAEAILLSHGHVLLATVHEFEAKYGCGKAIPSTEGFDVLASLRRLLGKKR
jgi:ADP-ribosylglycohydrolase